MRLNNPALIEKAKAIRVVLTDVDGILTDGKLYYSAQGEAQKVFHVRDGHGMKALLNNQITLGIISGRNSEAVQTRMQELGITIVHQGIHDKLPVYEDIIKSLKVSDEQVAYLGDDEPDLPVLARVGLSVTVNDAPAQLKAATDYCTQANGGHGAFREIADFILQAKNDQ